MRCACGGLDRMTEVKLRNHVEIVALDTKRGKNYHIDLDPQKSSQH
jgi:hypothetical protein